eukprot:Skav210231  [mRNA]  locus=scaffold2884:60006:84259:+ [translate_table: standard]
MPDLLLEKGYVTTHVMLPARTRAGILATVKELDEFFGRLPTEFELGYLGRGDSRSDRVAMLEVAEHLRLMKPGLLQTFGFRLSSRRLAEIQRTVASHPRWHGPTSVVLSARYEYQFDPAGECLVLQSFFLEEPLQLIFQKARPDSRMASRDPCEADLHEKLWAAVRHGGCDGFLEIPKTRFDVDQYVDYEELWGVQGCEEVRGMDPEQRIFMETGWMALADAGYKRDQVRIDSAHLGVFVGISGSEAGRRRRPVGASTTATEDWRDVVRVASANGVPETFIANRFSYVVNLKGPSFIVNTACSASLVALHSAKTHLLMQEDQPTFFCLTKVGDNYEDWQTTGLPHLSVKSGQAFERQVLHPLEAKCTSRCSAVAGPRDVNNRELAWLVKARRARDLATTWEGQSSSE